MSTTHLEMIDGNDPEWGLLVETSCAGMKLFIIGPDGTGAKFWFRDLAHVEELREGLEWIGPHCFRGGSLSEVGKP